MRYKSTGERRKQKDLFSYTPSDIIGIMEAEDIIQEMHDEGNGNRGVFYENFGSGIQSVLTPLSELLKESQDEHPELVKQIAQAMYRGY